MRESLLTYTSKLLTNNLPFLILRKSGAKEVEILHQSSDELHFTVHDTLTCGVFSKFQKSEDQVFIYGEVIKRFQWEINKVDLVSKEVTLSKQVRKEHEDRVNAAILTLNKTPIQKVVLSLKHKVEKTKTNEQIWATLLDTYPTAHCYFFYHPKVGSWMGATPETLISYKKERLFTMSLAGTKRAQSVEQIVWGIKEKEEQKLVTDYIITALEKVASDEVNVGATKTVKAGSLFHLQTLLNATVKFEKLNKAVKELHPTPAVCGLPRKEALDYILENENYDRKFYTGYFGIMDPIAKTADYYVNLRCMELDDTSISLYAGGGITGKSIAVDEVDEIQNKLSTMATVL